MTQTAYCTSQDVIELCSWPKFGQLTDSAQGRLIRAASWKIDEHCRRPYGFGEQSVTETFDGGGQSNLWLSLRPVKVISDVTINGEALDNSDGTAWTFDPQSGRLTRGRGREDSRFADRWPTGSQNLVVQYWGGYSSDEMPDLLIMGTAFLVRHYVEVGRIRGGVFERESIGDWSGMLVQDAGPVPPHVAALLVDFVQDDAFA